MKRFGHFSGVPTALVAAAVFVLVGCANGFGSSPTDVVLTGSLAVSIGESSTDVVMLPLDDTEIEITAYEIIMTGPGETRSTVIDATDTEPIFSNLEPGAWAITVVANNEEGITVGSESTIATVEGGQTAQAEVEFPTYVPDPYVYSDY